MSSMLINVSVGSHTAPHALCLQAIRRYQDQLGLDWTILRSNGRDSDGRCLDPQSGRSDSQLITDQLASAPR